MSEDPGYAGDIRPEDAWRTLRDEPDAELIDVRTMAEWAFVGLPDLSDLGKEARCIEWRRYPAMEPNDAFVEQVRAAVPNTEAPLLFLCRSGNRSMEAAQAMTAAGYRACYNVAEGFEGDKDENQHRGNLGGWKACGLPWNQK